MLGDRVAADSSLTGTDSQPDSRSWPRVAGRDDVASATLIGANLSPALPVVRGARRPRRAPDDGTARPMDLLGTRGGRRSPTTTCAAPGTDDDFDDAGWEPIDGARPLALDAGVRRHRRPAALPAPLRRDAARPRAGARWLTLRRALLPGRRLARRRLPRRHRGLLLPAHLRGHRGAARPRRARPRRRGDLPPPADRTAKRNLTGVFQHWDCLDPDWNPGGIWRPVRIERDRARCASPSCGCCAARPPPSGPCCVLRATARQPTPRARCRVRTTVGGARPRSTDQPLAAGENQVEWTVTVDRARGCGGRARSATPRSTTCTSACVLGADEAAARRDERAPPHRAAPGRACATGSLGQRRAAVPQGRQPGPDPDGPRRGHRPRSCAATSSWPCEAGLDLLRVHAHVTRPELYDAADEAGLLLWQDMPLQWGYARGIRKQAVRQAREAVDLLGHHPSIAHVVRPQRADGDRHRPVDVGRSEALRRMALQGGRRPGAARPGTGPSSTARSSGRSRRPTAPGRSIAHSGVLPHPPQLDGTDTPPLLRLVPRRRARLPGLPPRRCPRLARFVTEFGAQAVPDHAPTSASPSAGPTSTGSGSAAPTRCRRALFDRARAARRLRHLRRVARRHPGVPGRAHPPPHRDAAPAQVPARPAASPSSASPTATRRSRGRCSTTTARPKLAYDALRDGVPPVIVVADRLPATACRRRGARARRARGQRPAARRSTTPRSTAQLSVDGRRAARGAGAATSPPTPACRRRHRPDRRPRRARVAGRSRSTAATDGQQVGQPLRGDDRGDRPGLSREIPGRYSDPGVGSSLDGDDDSRRPPNARTTDPVHPRAGRTGTVAGRVLPVGGRQEVGDGASPGSCSWASSSST